ncbi:MAG: hypothetical protein MI976_16680 [Pseudomonadales bacterium]|nr:hypothetical protein [Pseudomonadales bacterium]
MANDTIFNIIEELDQFEHFVTNKDYEKSFQRLLKILNHTSVHRNKKDKVFKGLKRDEVAYVATRYVSCAFCLFMDDGFRLNQSGYESLQILGRNFAVIVAMTPYKNADHVIRHLVGQTSVTKDKESIDIYGFRKLIFLWSVYSDVQLPIDTFMRNHPDVVKYLFFNGLTFNNYIEEKVDARREHLLQVMAQPDFPLTLDDNSIAFAGPTWMYTAYPDSVYKHEAKLAVNRAYRNWMLSKGVSEPKFPATRAIKNKPKIVVIVEQMTINHAVFRCRGKALASLREQFYVVGMGLKDYVDTRAIEVFDEFIYFDENIIRDSRSNVAKVIKQKPDIILYLSLGMQNMTIPMATLRLAPIQAALVSHPTTTRMESIDYILSASAKDATEFSETVVVLPDGAFEISDRSDVSHESFAEVKGCDPIKIAIPSFAIKLTSGFINVLRRIAKQAQRNVEFHFFPYVVSLPYMQLTEDLDKLLPGSVVHKPYPYETYLAKIAVCHFHMSPFPFGNTNGNIDSTKVGVPITAMRGPGIESLIDVTMIKRMGMPDWVIASNEDEYVQLALELIHNDSKLAELTAFVKNIDLHSVFFSTPKSHTFTQAMHDIYLHHELIQKKGIEKINFEDLHALGVATDIKEAGNS